MDHLEPYLDPDDLREDGKFKAQVLAELPNDGEVRRLRPIMMGYFKSLGAIQNVFRAQTRDQLLVGLGTLSAAEGKFLQRFSLAFRRLLGAVSIDKNGDWGRVVYVGAALEDMIGYLNREHPRTLGLRSRKINY